MADPTAAAAPPAGLCARCAHARVLANRRGSRFYLCRRSAEDPAYARFPRLPVLSCPGYEPAPQDDDGR